MIRRTIALAAVAGLSPAALAQISTAFTYQGRLLENGAPVSGTYDLQFRLMDTSVGGAQVGSTLCANDVAAVDGLFTVQLDFGDQYNGGDPRFLEVSVRADTGTDCSDTSGFSTLSPRQSLSRTPFASHAIQARNANNAESADNANNAGTLAGFSASFYRNASNLNAGTLSDTRLSTNVPRLNAASVFTGAVTMNNAGNVLAGSGSGLTALNADSIASGLVAPARGGTGLDTSAAATGSLLFASATGTWSLRAPGSNNQVLKLVGGIPTWSTDQTAAGVSSIVANTGIICSPSPITSTGSIAIDPAVVPRLGSTNNFSSLCTFPGIQLGNGLANLPVVSFLSDTDTGLFRPAPDTIGLTVAGFPRLTLDSDSLDVTAAQIAAIGGSAAVPSYSFGGNLGTGLFGVGNGIGIAGNGTQLFRIDTTSAVFSNVPGVQFPNGAASAPGVSFASGLNGIFSPGAGALAFTAFGSERMRITSTGIAITSTTTAVDLNISDRITADVIGDAGNLSISGVANASLVGIHSVAGSGVHGQVGVFGPTGLRARLFVDPTTNLGAVAADNKFFVIPHPLDPAQNIWYSCLEGPESAIFCRGTGTLVNGEAVIELPETFRLIADEPTLTVQVTPRSRDTFGIAVLDSRLTGIAVGELRDGKGNFDFYWEAKASRRDHREYRVIRPWNENLSESDVTWAQQRLAWESKRRALGFSAANAAGSTDR